MTRKAALNFWVVGEFLMVYIDHIEFILFKGLEVRLDSFFKGDSYYDALYFMRFIMV